MTETSLPTRRLGRTGLTVTELALGTAPLGGLFTGVPESDARGVMSRAWEMGLRYFDTAPMYGLGRSERLLGDMLRQTEGPYVLSTKVGRLMVAPRAGQSLPPEPAKNPFDTGWRNGLPFREVFDYSYDAIMRSFDDSRQRLGLTGIDLLYVHDIGTVTHGARAEAHWAALTSGGGFRALEELRANGDIAGFGLGVNEAQVVADAMEVTDLDAFLLAGRYTLLDRTAGALIDKAQARGIGVVLGGVFNSGILAAPEGAHFTYDYLPAERDMVAKVARLRGICSDHGVPLAAAALRFPLRHPGVASVVLGLRTPDELEQAVAGYKGVIPDALWTDMDDEFAKAGDP